MNITDNAKEQQILPLLRLGFRPFFLFGSAFALIAIALWLFTLHGASSLAPLNNPLWWHAHEMLFGFVTAIIAGFLLTAVQNWTGIPGIKGKKLLLLVLLWMAARILLLANPDLPLLFVVGIDIAFLPAVAGLLAAPIIKIKQYRNLIFVPLLLLMTLVNALSYAPMFGFDASWATKAFYAMVLLVTLIVALIGGRVIPMFTANGTQTKKVVPIRWVEILSLLSLFVLFVCILINKNPQFIGSICIITAGLHLFRSLYWRPWVALRVPLVWSLHFSMLFIPIGLTLMGVHYLHGTVNLSTAMHSLTVGVIAGMIIAMMSRVSLGHSGRVLKVGPLVVLSFVSILLAALSRSVLMLLFPEYTTKIWLISGVLWCIAFSSFIWVYLPILSTPRADGRPG